MLFQSKNLFSVWMTRILYYTLSQLLVSLKDVPHLICECFYTSARAYVLHLLSVVCYVKINSVFAVVLALLSTTTGIVGYFASGELPQSLGIDAQMLFILNTCFPESVLRFVIDSCVPFSAVA